MTRAHRFSFASTLCVVALIVACLRPSAQAVDFARDVTFVLDQLEKDCGHFFKLKKIDWTKVRTEMTAAAAKTTNATEHWRVMMRIVARLRDGHASVDRGPNGRDVKPPVFRRTQGLGIHCCRVGKKVYVKAAWAAAGTAGLKPGMEITKIGGQPALKWLAERTAEYADVWSFSTDHHASFYTDTWGMLAAEGERIEIEFKTLKRKTKKRTLTPDPKTNQRPDGPAFYPEGAERHKDLVLGLTPKAYGYVSIRRCKGDLPAQMDHALSALRAAYRTKRKKKKAELKGLILDFRSNTGGAFDHDDLMGRFIPAGKRMRGQVLKGRVMKRYPSTSTEPYAGPIVVIVDATVVSAGETASGMFKEDGRAYMIGESPTAGMSSSKKSITLPSGLFKLRYSIASNKLRFNEMRGIEGIGVIPHEIVAYKPKDLANQKDTLIERAEAILKRFPKKKVPFEKAFTN